MVWIIHGRAIPEAIHFPYVVNKNVTFTPRGLFLTTPYDLKTPHNLFVESECPETGCRRLARFGQLYRNPDDAYVDSESDQSGRF